MNCWTVQKKDEVRRADNQLEFELLELLPHFKAFTGTSSNITPTYTANQASTAEKKSKRRFRI